jgi:hypothetical protein
VLTAIFGLIGVVVGASASGFVSYVLQRRRERASLRSAVRLLQEDLGYAHSLLDSALEDGAWWPSSFELPVETWSAQREIVTAYVDVTTWLEVSGAFGSIRNINAARVGAAERGEPRFADELAHLLEDARTHADDASTLLVRYAR